MSETITPAAHCFQWQQHLWHQLLQQATGDRLPHALLLSGPRGTGKVHFAERLVGWWLCDSPENGSACGHCRSCHLLATGGHPDFCFPQTSGKSEQLRVDEIRDLVTFFGKTAQLGDRRAALLQPASSMNVSAQNALLKTLEEPGENTLLLLVADQPQLLLPTIRSRCQQIWFPVPDKAVAMAWLARQGLEGTAAEAALASAGGTPLQAQQLAGSDWFQQRTKLVDSLISLAAGRASLASVEQTFAALPQQELLEMLCNWCHQGLRVGFLAHASQGQEPTNEAMQDQAMQGMVTLAHKVGSRALSYWHVSLQKALAAHARSSNLNKELQLDHLLWQLTPQGVASNLGQKARG